MQSRVLAVEAKPIDRFSFIPMSALQPKWSGTVGGIPLAIIPKKASGGVEIDLEIKW